jgi:predicted membrane channel-forming protein YqfA (hemolysin III family)
MGIFLHSTYDVNGKPIRTELNIFRVFGFLAILFILIGTGAPIIHAEVLGNIAFLLGCISLLIAFASFARKMFLASKADKIRSSQNKNEPGGT